MMGMILPRLVKIKLHDLDHTYILFQVVAWQEISGTFTLTHYVYKHDND